MRKNTWLETITALAFLFFVGIVLYYSLWPFKVTTLNSIGIDAAEYCRGDWAQIDMRFVKHMDVEAEVTWYIVDGVVYELDSPGISRPVGENHVIIQKQVPLSIRPGKYNFRVTQEYNVHPFHKTITNTWNTPTFIVKDSDECPNEEDASKIPDPISRPVITQPTPASQPTLQAPQAQSAGGSAQPVEQSTTVVTEQRSEPQTFTPEPENTPIKDLLDAVVKPVKGLLP